jgi:membrane associated rhomboid family serine protease
VSFDPFDSDGQVFPLQGGRPPIVLRSDEMEHPVGGRGKRRTVTKYSEITHLTTSTQAIWIGTQRSVYILGRAMFSQTGGPENLMRALARRIAERPGGVQQLERMAAIEREARSVGPLRATWALVGICVAVFALQLLLGPSVEAVGNFTPAFFRDGDLWRIVTANLIHAAPTFPLHLALNMLALIVLGALVERPLGAARTVTIMGISGVCAMAASAVFGQGPVVGASGVAFGLVGAAVWLEFAWADRLPAWWRYPRRSLLLLLVINGVIGLLVPVISGSAHMGGLVGGGIAAAALTRSPTRERALPGWILTASIAVAATTAFAVATAGWELARPGDYTARHAARLAQLPGISAVELNDTAWLIAISTEPSRELMEAALLLAEQAVDRTERRDPNVLDTLAEVQFLLGRPEQAVATIDEAIAHAPEVEYFREQRRRFTGERDADDRPTAPIAPWLYSPEPGADPPSSFDEPGLTV